MTNIFQRLKHLTLSVNFLERHICADCAFFRRGKVCEANASKCLCHPSSDLSAVDVINGHKNEISFLEQQLTAGETQNRVAG